MASIEYRPCSIGLVVMASVGLVVGFPVIKTSLPNYATPSLPVLQFNFYIACLTNLSISFFFHETFENIWSPKFVGWVDGVRCLGKKSYNFFFFNGCLPLLIWTTDK